MPNRRTVEEALERGERRTLAEGGWIRAVGDLHRHEFVPARWVRVFGVLVQVPARQTTTPEIDDGWACETCGEQGYEVAA